MTDRDLLEDLCAKILSTNDVYWALAHSKEYEAVMKHLHDPRPVTPTPKGCEECSGPMVHATFCMECDPDRCLTCGGDGSVREE